MKLNNLFLILISFLFFLSFSCNNKEETKEIPAVKKPSAPSAKKVAHTINIHGVELNDEYFWMKDKSNPEVLAYLHNENLYADSIMSHTSELQQELFLELQNRVPEEISIFKITDQFEYFSRQLNDQSLPIYLRRSIEGNKEEVLLNLNEVASGEGNISLAFFEISPDEQMIAFAADTTGSENYALYVKNIAKNEVFDTIPAISHSAAWANGNQTIYYTTQDESGRPDKVFMHKIDLPYEDDKLVFLEEDPAFYLKVKRSKNNQYLILNSESQSTTEVHTLPANEPNQDFMLFSERQFGVKYQVFPHEKEFFILTNHKSSENRVMRASAGATEKYQWQDYIKERENGTIEDLDVVPGFMALYVRENGTVHLEVGEMKKGTMDKITFDEPIYSLTPDFASDYSRNTFRFHFESLTSPPSVYEYDPKTRNKVVIKQKIISNYNPEEYTSQKIYATAKDGTSIPISLVHKKSTPLNGQAPLYLYGYGAYGFPSFPAFFASADFSNRISLLDRGFIFAIAHVRGSGDNGRQWYEAGKLMHKKNSFTDFIDCASFLISEEFTTPEKLIAMGGSAGGLLMATVANMRPDFFKIIIAKVPFVDLIHTMLDPDLPYTVMEYEEWGTPQDEEAFNYMLTYSPYDNIEVKAYPNMLITAGYNDASVGFWEAAKWTARLREYNTSSNTILLKTSMDGGHSGSSNYTAQLKDVAFEYAFILDILGLKNKKL
ncbi:oligopeptidase B [soil metagenome]